LEALPYQFNGADSFLGSPSFPVQWNSFLLQKSFLTSSMEQFSSSEALPYQFNGTVSFFGTSCLPVQWSRFLLRKPFPTNSM
jgi:hypothetical protein